MHEHLVDLLLLLEFPVFLGLAAERLAPSLSALGVASGELDDSLDLLYLLAHACMQLYLHRVQVEVNVLTEANQEGQRLLNASLLREVVARSQL